MSELCLSAYKEVFIAASRNIETVGESVPLPHFQVEILMDLLNETRHILSFGKTVVHLDGNFVIVGDIHGSLHDLLTVFTKNGFPPETNYIFLGDYVDRGQFSLEVIVLLFAIQCIYPAHITLLRGNHEFPTTNEKYGFLEEIVDVYGCKDLWFKFNEVFTYMPIAAVLNHEYFCVHGGISPLMAQVSDLESYMLPIIDADSLINDLVWSDPNETAASFLDNPRGHGKEFGMVAATNFLFENGLKKIIRGHQCVSHGIEFHLDDQVVTVFTASDYAKESNYAGYLVIHEGNFDAYMINHKVTMTRKEAHYYDVIAPKSTLLSKPHSFSSLPNLLHIQKGTFFVSRTLARNITAFFCFFALFSSSD